jgi:hypothetical protein
VTQGVATCTHSCRSDRSRNGPHLGVYWTSGAGLSELTAWPSSSVTDTGHRSPRRVPGCRSGGPKRSVPRPAQRLAAFADQKISTLNSAGLGLWCLVGLPWLKLRTDVSSSSEQCPARGGRQCVRHLEAPPDGSLSGFADAQDEGLPQAGYLREPFCRRRRALATDVVDHAAACGCEPLIGLRGSEVVTSALQRRGRPVPRPPEAPRRSDARPAAGIDQCTESAAATMARSTAPGLIEGTSWPERV